MTRNEKLASEVPSCSPLFTVFQTHTSTAGQGTLELPLPNTHYIRFRGGGRVWLSVQGIWSWRDVGEANEAKGGLSSKDPH